MRTSPFGLDNRSDVVQHDAGDRGRVRHRKVHGEQSAAGAADEDGGADRERGQHGDNIGEFDQEVIVLRIAVVFGPAAPARVDRKNAARAGICQSGCERVEICNCAREPRQANNWKRGRSGRAVFAHMNSQPVRRADKNAASRIRYDATEPY